MGWRGYPSSISSYPIHPVHRAPAVVYRIDSRGTFRSSDIGTEQEIGRTTVRDAHLIDGMEGISIFNKFLSHSSCSSSAALVHRIDGRGIFRSPGIGAARREGGTTVRVAHLMDGMERIVKGFFPSPPSCASSASACSLDRRQRDFQIIRYRYSTESWINNRRVLQELHPSAILPVW